jgi:NADH-quinone oxidoreductase subunit D
VKYVLDQCRQGIKDVDNLITSNEVFKARTQNVGVISAADAIDWGTTGPVLRGSGVPFDVRKDEPYLFYDQVDFDVPVGQVGDVYDRWCVRIEEMRQSVRIVEQCLAKLQPGPIMPERMPRMLRTPPGEVYIRTEAPRGEYGIYMVSKGGNRPHRLKIRSACFTNLQALKDMSVGNYVADAVLILGSLDIVLGETDR